MAQIDKQKEIVGMYKASFFFVLGTLFALLAYIFQNYDKLSDNKLILLNGVVLFGVFSLIFVVKRLKEKFSGKFIIGHIGALDDKHKGQTIIINLAKSLQTKYPDILFLLLGTGDDEQYLKNLAKGLNNVVFEGFVHNVIDYIAIFDIFLFPSRNEGLGSTLLDVIEGEVCIVASDVGGIPDIITNDKTGILFDINNQEKLEEIIISLYNDKEKCQTLTLEAKKSIDKYSVETMCKSYIDIYKNIINPT